jgi:hypothetical protein
MLRTLRSLTLSLAALLMLGTIATASASAAASPELYFKVNGTKITSAVPFKSKSKTGTENILYGEIGTTKTEIVCTTEQGLGFLEPVGLTKLVAVFEGCKVKPSTLESVCQVVRVNVWALDHLFYEVGNEHILDVFEPPTGSEDFAVITITGSSLCPIKGEQMVKGKAAARLSPERSEATTGTVKFEAAANHEAQVPPKYNETANNSEASKEKEAKLEFAGKPAAFSSADEVELLSGEAWGVF